MDTPPTALEIGLKQSGKLLAFVAVSWLLLVWPAYELAGTAGLLGLSVAAFLCLIPGVAAFLIVSLLQFTNAAAYSIGAATILRLFFVAAGGLIVRELRPDLGLKQFHVWVLAFYLATLMFETVLLAKSSQAGNPSSRSAGDNASAAGMTGIQG